MAFSCALSYFYSRFVAIIFTSVVFHCCYAKIEGPVDFCMSDTFTANCVDKGVIRILTAKYGRMRMGKCVRTDSGLGCTFDAINILHSACSGKSECSFSVLNDELYDNNPCLDMVPYLEISYECIQVLTAPQLQCDSSNDLFTHGSHGYISSHVARSSGCGDMDHPWHVDVLPGQRVNLTLVYHSGLKSPNSHAKCQLLGYIIEQGHRSNTSICGSSNGEELIYTSNGRKLQIHIATKHDVGQQPEFLIRYDVFGCADLQIPELAWYKREGDAAVVGCAAQDVTWKLSCENNQWKGVIGNCSENVAASEERSESFWNNKDIDVKQVGILCLAIGFVVLITISGVVIVCKLRSRASPPPSTILLQEEQHRVHQGPLPPIPQDNSQYRSLFRQPNPHAFPPNSQTMRQTLPRPQPQDLQRGQHQDLDDYSADWKFGTAPWNKPEMRI